MLRTCSVLATLTLLSTGMPYAAATTEFLRVPGDVNGDDFGQAVAAAGDVNADGVPDVIVGSPRFHSSAGASFDEEGKAVVYSGRDGTKLRTILGQFDQGHFGWAVAGIGDVDGDGHGDLAVGVPDRHYVFWVGGVIVYSGKTGAMLYDVYSPYVGGNDARLGASLAALGDVNGDGVPDFAAGAPFADVVTSIGTLQNAGEVIVFSGADGAEIRRFSGSEVNGWFGESVANAGDVNHDGRDDLVIGEPLANLSSALPTVDCGRVTVYSIIPGVMLQSHSGGLLNHGYQLGRAVAGGFDANGDGTTDVAGGAPSADSSATNAGQLSVYSGTSGALLWARDGNLAAERLGGAVAGIGDLDGDGRDEVLGGAPFSNIGSPFGVFEAGIVRVYAGVDGTILDHAATFEPGVNFGASVARVADLNGDGLDDFIAGAPDGDGHQIVSGYASIVLTKDCNANTYNYGIPLAGTSGVPALTLDDDPTLCSSTSLDLGNSFGQLTAGTLYIGAQEANLPTGFGASLLVAPPLIPVSVVLPPAGASIPVSIPCDATLCGARVYMQLLLADPGAAAGVAFSYGLFVEMGG